MIRMHGRARHLSWAGGLLAGVLLVAPAAGASGPVAAKDEEQSGFAPVEETDWWFEAMKLGQAHKQTMGAGVTIGLLEDTLDTSVPELRGQDIEMRENCGYAKSKPLKGDPYAGHGTSMAALIVGSGSGTDAGRGVQGVAPESTVALYGVDADLRDEANCLESGKAPLIQTAVQDGADILNMSFVLGWGPNWGYGDNAADGDLDPAINRGVVVVAATVSNGGRATYPAAHPGVVSVVAVDEDAQPWSEMPRSESNVIAAPGVRVGSGTMTESGWRSDGWHDGSSNATAIVSGALALVKSKYPDATGNQLIQHMIHNPGGDGGYGWSSDYGFGIVSVSHMLESDPAQWPDENPLLEGPRAAVKAYPMWSSSEIDAPEGADDKWARAERADPGDGDGSVESAADGAVEAGIGAGSEGSPLPVWGWVAVGVGALLLLAGALFAGKLRKQGV